MDILVVGSLPLLEGWREPVAVPKEDIPGPFYGAVSADIRTICKRGEEPRTSHETGAAYGTNRQGA